MANQETMHLVKEYGFAFSSKHVKEFLTYIELTDVDFNKVLDKHGSTHNWKRDRDQYWLLR
jgi:hypothetical protein